MLVNSESVIGNGLESKFEANPPRPPPPPTAFLLLQTSFDKNDCLLPAVKNTRILGPTGAGSCSLS